MTIMTREAAKFWANVELPKEVAYLYNDGGNTFLCGDDHPYWKQMTYAELKKRKIIKQKNELQQKRMSDEIVIKPCFIHVFYNSGWIFNGWWIYITTLQHSYGITFRHEADHQMVEKAMKLFPCDIIPLFENFEDKWAPAFAKTYRHVGYGRKTKQGLRYCWCKIKNGKLVDLFTK